MGLHTVGPAAVPARIPSGGRHAPGSPTLEVAAEAEYAYILRDVRRIVRIGGGLLALMFALWVALSLTGSVA